MFDPTTHEGGKQLDTLVSILATMALIVTLSLTFL